MMLPIINAAVLFGAIFTFTDMTAIYILTRGGPHDMTQVIPSEAFFTGVLGSDLAEGQRSPSSSSRSSSWPPTSCCAQRTARR